MKFYKENKKDGYQLTSFKKRAPKEETEIDNWATRVGKIITLFKITSKQNFDYDNQEIT